MTARLPISRTVMLIEALVGLTVRRGLRVASLFGHSRLLKDKLVKFMTLAHKVEGSYSSQDVCCGRADKTQGPQRESDIFVALLGDVSGRADVQAMTVKLSDSK